MIEKAHSKLIEHNTTLNREERQKLIEELLVLFGVMHWVELKEEMPPLHTHILLYDISNNNQSNTFVHESMLSSDAFFTYWTHWAAIKPPYA